MSKIQLILTKEFVCTLYKRLNTNELQEIHVEGLINNTSNGINSAAEALAFLLSILDNILQNELSNTLQHIVPFHLLSCQGTLEDKCFVGSVLLSINLEFSLISHH